MDQKTRNQFLRNRSVEPSLSGHLPSPRLLPNAVPTTLGVHPRRDVHTRQLLEEQLGRVRNVNLRNLGLVLTRTALELVALEVAAGAPALVKNFL